MESFGPQQIGKFLLLTGIILALIGVIIILLGHLGLFRLPGDLQFGGKNWKVYIPIASCIIISIILTLILLLISYFSRSR
jgi:ABC-type antimicrobial peptide transport system permease subunit